MRQKCIPGVICIENTTIFFFILIILILVYLFYLYNQNINKFVTIEKQPSILTPLYNNTYHLERSKDILLNPYTPPLRNDNIITNYLYNTPLFPINISTQGVESSYRQVGILTRLTGKEQILPLMGKPLITNKDKWNFYTMTDKNNMIKLPVSYKGKSCTNEYGCDNIYNNDNVYVEGYNDAFKATIYDNDTMKYIPFI